MKAAWLPLGVEYLELMKGRLLRLDAPKLPLHPIAALR